VFSTVTAPSCSAPVFISSLTSGRMRRSSGLPDFIAVQANSRTLCSAQIPPTKPSMLPSLVMSATSPACALVGRWARTTVAVAKAAPCAASSSARRASASFLTAEAARYRSSRPRRGPGSTACPCA
jgi:hypothetical protein